MRGIACRVAGALTVGALALLLATASASALVAPKWYVTPTVDGNCADSGYGRADAVTLSSSVSGATATARIIHSGLDAYLCIDNIPARANGVEARFDFGGRHPGQAGVIRLSAGRDGRPTLARSDASGQFTPVPAGPALAGAASPPSAAPWSAEFRVGLDWLGGYSRVERLGLFLTGFERGNPTWPDGAGDDPATWGPLSMAPVYAPGLGAGSVFTDGLKGHLVIPFPPELTPGATTIEAWVRPAAGGCGTVLGAGERTSLWLSLCRTAQFGTRGPGSAVNGRSVLPGGWHHIAATVDPLGQIALYVDGAPDGGTAPGFLEEPPNFDYARLAPVPYGSLLVGADIDNLAGAFHGYVRELRVWDHARTAQEIRADAFRRLGGQEPGLIGLWPFAGSLADLAGGHDAGLTGNAALARAALDVQHFPSPPRPRAYRFRPAHAPHAFNGRLPFSRHPVKVDGLCPADEYHEAADIRLEPGRAPSIKAMTGPGGLHVCTGLLFGENKPGNALSLLVERAGDGSRHPKRTALRVLLTPGGATTAVGNGSGFVDQPVAGVTAHVATGAGELRTENLALPALAYWAGEVTIAPSALRPLGRGGTVRLALRYVATPQTPPGAPGRLDAQRLGWPRGSAELQPSSWGLVHVASRPARHVQRLIRSAGAAGEVRAAGATRQKPPPTEANYNVACPIQGKAKYTPLGLGYITDPVVKWKLVDPNQPFAQADGSVRPPGPSISHEDAYPIHASHDLDGEITATKGSRNLVINGDSTLKFETESLGIARAFRPRANDHVTILGRWIFDCGHEENRHTELHPIFAIESDRDELRPMLAGAGLRHVRTADVWFNSQPSPGVTPDNWDAGFVHPFDQPFRFSVPLPSPGSNARKKLFVKVQALDGGSVGDVRLTGVDATNARFKVTPQNTGTTAYRITLGFLTGTDSIDASIGQTFRVQPKDLTVVDNLDDQFTRGSGDWHFDLIANGQWRRLLGQDGLGQEELVGSGGPPIDLSGVAPIDITAPGYQDLVMTGTGYEDDSPAADPGICGFNGGFACLMDDDLSSDSTPVLGDLAALADGNDHFIQLSNVWSLRFSVTKVDPPGVPSMLADFWKPLLADEPNDTDADATALATPPGAKGHRPVSYSHKGFITENPLSHNGVFHIDGDTDRYALTAGEFSNMTFGSLPAHLGRTNVQKFWNDGYQPPLSVQDKLGTWGVRLSVHRTSGSPGKRSYKQRESVSWRNVPPDSGEPADGNGGRLVDLTKVPQGLGSIDDNFDVPGIREKKADWAWQHTPGDVDTYRVRAPGGTPPPAGHTENSCDILPHLEISAPGMDLSVVHGPAAKDQVSLDSLAVGSSPPDFVVDVQSATGKRGVYRLTAHWEDAVWVDLGVCLARGGKQKVDAVHTVAPFPFDQKVPVWNPDPTSTFKVGATIFDLGGFNPIKLGRGSSLKLTLASPAGQPISGLLFDGNGVLLGESAPLSKAQRRGARVADGLLPVARLSVGGLTAGQTYILVPVGGFPLGAALSVDSQVGGSLAH